MIFLTDFSERTFKAWYCVSVCSLCKYMEEEFHVEEIQEL